MTANTLNTELPHAKLKEKDLITKLHYLRHFQDISGKILDVGCLTGNFLVLNKEKIQGVDVDRAAIDIAKKRGCKADNLDICQKLEFEDDSFDAINCAAVLEHLKDPQTAVKEMFRVLKPGGKLVITTPDILKWKFDFWKCAYHLYGFPFSESSLYAVAYDAGFRNILVTHDYCAIFVNELNKVGISPKNINKIQSMIHKFKKSRNLLLIAYK